jgi:hypothetical protein
LSEELCSEKNTSHKNHEVPKLSFPNDTFTWKHQNTTMNKIQKQESFVNTNGYKNQFKKLTVFQFNNNT